MYSGQQEETFGDKFLATLVSEGMVLAASVCFDFYDQRNLREDSRA